MKHLLFSLFMLSFTVGKCQMYFNFTAGPQVLSFNRSAELSSNDESIVRKIGVGFNFEPEVHINPHFSLGLLAGYAQYGFEKHHNSNAWQLMLNFKFPITVTKLQPYIGFGAGYLNQTDYGLANDKYGNHFPIAFAQSYAGISPYIGLNWMLTQSFYLTANYRYSAGIYTGRKVVFEPVCSGVNLGITILMRPKNAPAAAQ